MCVYVCVCVCLVVVVVGGVLNLLKVLNDLNLIDSRNVGNTLFSYAKVMRCLNSFEPPINGRLIKPIDFIPFQKKRMNTIGVISRSLIGGSK